MKMAGENSEIIIESRKSVSVSGADGIVSFTETEAVLSTILGELAITGEGLVLGGFDKTVGKVDILGTIRAVFYPGQKKDSRGFFEKLFT